MTFAPEDVTLTAGAFAAIALAFRLVMDAGAEVIIPVPGWFCYAPMLRVADLVPVKVALDPERFDLDLAAIEAAITPRTRMVVVNSPGNPTGRIYSSAPTSRRWPNCWSGRRGGSGHGSGCSRTSPTAASASTATASPVRQNSIPTR